MKWAHSTSIVVLRGRTKVVCSCGAQSPFLTGEAGVKEWVEKHTKVREVRRVVDERRLT